LATIEDVAKRAGVSVATVSRVINGSGVVSPERAAHVRAAIDEMNYRPNTSGRNLRRGETKTLLVICSVALDPVLNGVHDAAEAMGYQVAVNYIGRKREKNVAYFNDMFYGNVDGVLLYSAFYNDTELFKLSRNIRRNFPSISFPDYFDLAAMPYDRFGRDQPVILDFCYYFVCRFHYFNRCTVALLQYEHLAAFFKYIPAYIVPILYAAIGMYALGQVTEYCE
jgi:hypothetical protein